MSNPHQDLIDLAQAQASRATNNSSGDKYNSQVTVHLIASNGRVEEAINRFNTQNGAQTVEMKKLVKAQLSLAKSQVAIAKSQTLLAKVGLLVAVVAVLVAIGLGIFVNK